VPASIVALFDPELIIPSATRINDLEFWIRLEEWTRDDRPRLGPATFKGVTEMIENVPNVVGMPVREFWKIIGRVMSRPLTQSSRQRSLCTAHIRADYEPALGDQTNVERLVDDLSHVDDDSGIVLATDQRCWRSVEPALECEGQRICLTTVPCHSYSLAWRSIVLASRTLSPNALKENATHMFPKVKFSESAWTRTGSLSGDPRDIAKQLLLHISVLNDHASRIWNTTTDNGQREQEFGSLGLTVSPEGPRTHQSNKAMKERYFTFDGKSVLCEWHTKLKPNIDRVYFSVEGDSVYVGIIVDHLRL